METLTVRRRRRLFLATRHDGQWTLQPIPAGAPTQDVDVKVRCGGRMHTVKLTKRGALVMCDHKDKTYDEAISVQATLGGPQNRCRQILKAWKDGAYPHQALNQWRWSLFGRRQTKIAKPRTVSIVRPNGKKHNHLTGDSLANGSLATREKGYTTCKLEASFRGTGVYRNAFLYGVKVKSENCSRAVILKAHVDGVTETKKTANNLHMRIGVPMRWHKAVGDHSTFDGHVVMELGKKTETKHITSYVAKLLRVIQTKRGPLPVMQMATVYKKGRGWVITWHRTAPELPLKISFT